MIITLKTREAYFRNLVKGKAAYEFLFQKIDVGNFKILLFIIKIIFTLSHCQASGERQFIINNIVLDYNVRE